MAIKYLLWLARQIKSVGKVNGTNTQETVGLFMWVTVISSGSCLHGDQIFVFVIVTGRLL